MNYPRVLSVLAAILLLVCPGAHGAPPAPSVPSAAVASAHFDAEAATNAWLASVPAGAHAKSDAYFEGGYWLMLWDFLASAAVMLILLETGLSARMRNFAERVTTNTWVHAFLYWLEFAIVTTLLLFPLNVYEEFFREHQYGLSNQTFGGWLRDATVAFAVSLIFGGLVVATLFVLVRRLPRTWHLWGATVAIAFIIFGIVIAPVFILPLFNTYTPLKNVAIKQQILSLAHANGIPVNDVYEVDASKQSKRVSANVSGLFGTDRITLNDNLLARCSPQAVMSVMGHEMGHYVMHHVLNSVLFMAFMVLLLFSLLRWGLDRALKFRGARWQIGSIGDVAVLPLAALLLSIFSFILTPVFNTYTRTQEYEADIFGLDAARQPDGEAEVDLLLGEYRKLNPGPLEEFIFFDHPSGRTRIYAAMRWKAENLCLFDARLTCANAPAALLRPAPSGSSSQSEAPLR
ncbi:MAG: M48 family metallopeptidase [Acidobacteriota bacterium]|nr:M48 family metallopeptidase [Acidobacteriota bacterium]